VLPPLVLQVAEYSCLYDGAVGGNQCQVAPSCESPSGNRSITNRKCQVTIHVSVASRRSVGEVTRCLLQIEKEMKAPVYVYYELDNFYQNHRRYVKSRDDNQLLGKIVDVAKLTANCDPLLYGDIPNAQGQARILHPCGLIANSFFNDTIPPPAARKGSTTLNLTWSETGISWETDRLFKFKPVSAADKAANIQTHQFIDETYPGIADVTNEHFIVWMRTAALPRFRKLYARIDTTIPEDSTLVFDIGVNFPVHEFQGSKSLVLSTVSFLGGKNDFLGLAYIAVGGVCAALAIFFAIKEWLCPRRPGDIKFLRLPTR
jgi:hypothetical protein